jgi:hypothetical protein
MNNDLYLSDEDLRRITSRKLPPGTALSEEQATARDAYLSFGELLKAAPSSIDEQRLVECLKRSAAVEPVERRKTRKRSWLLLAGVTAAAVAVIVFLRVPLARHDAPAVADRQENRHAAAEHGTSGTAPSTFTWHDALDEEIAVAAANISQISDGQRGFDASLLDMNAELSALSQELLGESL